VEFVEEQQHFWRMEKKKLIVNSQTRLYCYRTRVRSLFTLVTNSLTDSLTDSCLVNLIDVTLACEDANSKLVDVVTVADEDLL